MVEKFPTCGKFWKQYIEHEMKNGNYENVEKLFKRCLVSGKNQNIFWKQFSATCFQKTGSETGFISSKSRQVT